MGTFTIEYISRDGHRTEEEVHAKTKRLARLQAKGEHDDVLSVRRKTFDWSWIFVFIIIITGVLVIYHLF